MSGSFSGVRTVPLTTGLASTVTRCAPMPRVAVSDFVPGHGLKNQSRRGYKSARSRVTAPRGGPSAYGPVIPALELVCWSARDADTLRRDEKTDASSK